MVCGFNTVLHYLWVLKHDFQYSTFPQMEVAAMIYSKELFSHNVTYSEGRRVNSIVEFIHPKAQYFSLYLIPRHHLIFFHQGKGA